MRYFFNYAKRLEAIIIGNCGTASGVLAIFASKTRRFPCCWSVVVVSCSDLRISVYMLASPTQPFRLHSYPIPVDWHHFLCLIYVAHQLIVADYCQYFSLLFWFSVGLQNVDIACLRSLLCVISNARALTANSCSVHDEDDGTFLWSRTV